MKVQWSETNFIAFDYACKNYPQDCPQLEDYTKQYEGHVIFTYRSFWGVPKFLVKLKNGTFRSVSCTQCKAVGRHEQGTTA